MPIPPRGMVRRMRPATKLLTYLVVLGAALGVGAGLGAAVGPIDVDGRPEPAGTFGHEHGEHEVEAP